MYSCGPYVACTFSDEISASDAEDSARDCVTVLRAYISSFNTSDSTCRCTTQAQYETSGITSSEDNILFSLRADGDTIQVVQQCL
jgi:hypothetical protein